MPSFIKAWKYKGEDQVFAAGNSNSLTTLMPIRVIGAGTMQFFGPVTTVGMPVGITFDGTLPNFMFSDTETLMPIAVQR